MSLAQYIYGTTCTDRMTASKAILISEKSIEVCERLGLTGRVFSTRESALAITEGPKDMVQRYVSAVQNDALVKTLVVHTHRLIKAREFSDYSVWLDFNMPFTQTPQVHAMTPRCLHEALPAAPSARLRIMMDALFDKGRLVA